MTSQRVVISDLSVDIAARRIVAQANLEIDSAEVVGILGRNGSGKSTLLKAIYRTISPASGEVHIAQASLAQTRPRAWARLVAVLGQDNVDDAAVSVREAVALGRTPHHRGFGGDTEEDRIAIEEALARTDTVAMAQRRMTTLSGGERQRVRLARALAQRTPVLILDEPTNHLDVQHRYELLDLVRSLGATTLIAIHDLDLALRYCDRIVVLDGGGIAHVGPPAEVLTTQLLRDVFGVDAQVHTDPHTQSQFLHIHGAAPTPTLAPHQERHDR